jgi:hypothetical protein
VAKKRTKSETDEQRQRRHLVSLQQKTRANLEALDVDVDAMFKGDAVALRQVHKASQQLREMHDRMQRPDSVGPTSPTRERRSHATSDPREIEINPASPPAHRFEWPLEGIRNRLTEDQFKAAERLREAYLTMQPRSAVADPTGVGGASDPSSRLAFTERQEIAAREYEWCMRYLDGRYVSIVANFVLEREPEGKQRCLTIVEYGNKLSGMSGPHAGKAAGLVAIILTCDRLRRLWNAYDEWDKERRRKAERRAVA